MKTAATVKLDNAGFPSLFPHTFVSTFLSWIQTREFLSLRLPYAARMRTHVNETEIQDQKDGIDQVDELQDRIDNECVMPIESSIARS